MSKTSVNDLVRLEEIPKRFPNIFPSVESVRWYLREHREGLEEAGALLLIRGRITIAPETFESYVIEAGRRAARARNA